MPDPQILINTHTGPSADTGTASASSTFSVDYPPWDAVDGVAPSSGTDAVNAWLSEAVVPSVSSPQWWRYDFDTPQIVTGFRFRTRDAGTYNYPRDFILQGSTDGTEWVDLLTHSGLSGLSSAQWSQTFAVTNQQAYTIYRLLITARVNTNTGADWVGFAEIEFFGQALDIDIDIDVAADDATAAVQAVHPPNVSANVTATAGDALADIVAHHIPDISVALSAETDAASAEISALQPPHWFGVTATTDEATASLPGYHYWDVRPGQTVYDLTLTGADDGQPDVVLPISTFQGRLRNGSPSYLQVTVPDAATWSEAVTARPNGQLVLRKGRKFADGSRQMEEIARVNLEMISDARGTRSQTMTLSGHLTTSAAAPKSRTLSGISYRQAGTGKKRYRGPVDLFLRPGDTAVVPGYESITVGLINYVVSANPPSETMEITEA